MEIRRKTVYQLTLNKDLDASGVTIDTELHHEYSLQVIVSDVQKDSDGDRFG